MHTALFLKENQPDCVYEEGINGNGIVSFVSVEGQSSRRGMMMDGHWT